VPRPSKTIRRQKVNAGIEWKKGNRAEACKLWADADKGRKELQAKKKKHKQGTAPADEAAEGEAPQAEA
jgi:hypothetical protein